MNKKGVSCKRHYRCLGPQNLVPLLFHLEKGMVNQAWESFEEWVDDAFEIVPSIERDGQK
jgi:hypothetical protein